MSWRSILISQPCKLSLKQKQMYIQQKVNDFTVPLEDIAIIVIESQEVVITLPLLSALAQSGTTLLSCDEQFLPCGQWLPFSQYHRQFKTLKLQLQTTQPQKKQLWQSIIQQKIRNQALVLIQTSHPEQAKRLFMMADKVKSGDKDNDEAHAAAIYFPTLFGKGFVRWQSHTINEHLNYAYIVLRSAIARSLVSYGWLPSLGLFHHSEQNPFNLADDFIEPFRPLVDLMVWHLWQKGELQEKLSPIAKQKLIKLLNYQIRINAQKHSVLTAIDRCVSTFQSALIEKNTQRLKLPEILPLKEHEYE